MNNEEIQSLINQLKATGLSDEQIMETFYEAFQKGEMDRADLEALANAMDYELTDEFKNEPAQDPINAPAEGGEGGEAGAAPANAEEQAKEFKENIDDKGEGAKAPEELQNPGSTAAEENKGEGEGEDKPEEGKPEENKGEGQPAPQPAPESKENDDEEEWKEAQEKLKW